jgi:outer membrane protein assembly factor BamB
MRVLGVGRLGAVLACGAVVWLAAEPAVRGASQPTGAERYWPQWRGPLGTGEAPHARPPVEWSEGKNVAWKVALPGQGKSTPVIWGDVLYVTTAVEASAQTGSKAAAGSLDFVLLALGRADGKVRWQRTLRTEPPHEGTHKDGSFAGGSALTDGERVYAYFGSRGLYALTLDGQPLWQKDLGRMQTRNAFGEGSSPAVHDGSLVVTWDHEGGDFVVAFDAKSGREKWRRERDEPTTWATPHVVVHDGRAQAVVGGTNRLLSYDLATGATVWEAPGLTLNVIPSPVSANGVVYAMSGFRGNALRAIRLAEARGTLAGPPGLAWTYDRDTPYVPSPLLYRDGLYFLKSNSGILTCLDARGGAAHYTERLDTNRLDDGFDASPALVDGELYLRGARHLYRIEARQ